ncbi:MAG TPA: hypothetical protein ENJ95_24575 [Bacteroidetes bacterium]|nr:hypothetical protein [Bacteroidota bacterium]
MKNQQFLFVGLFCFLFLLSQNVLFGQSTATCGIYTATATPGFISINNDAEKMQLLLNWVPTVICQPCVANTPYQVQQPGTYDGVQIWEIGWSPDCLTGTITILPVGGGSCANNGGDADGDGVCADVDCNDNDPNITTFTVGSACDDGDANTENDAIQADGCTCAGTPIGGGTSVWAQNGPNINYDTGLGGIGKVGIGEANPAYTLSVNGNVGAREYKATLNGWSDYVFAKDYNLMPLGELEKYIGSNQHLPGIPSEKEVLAKGIFLGEMNALLLAKVEELTLHVIKLRKEIDKLKAGK